MLLLAGEKLWLMTTKGEQKNLNLEKGFFENAPKQHLWVRIFLPSKKDRKSLNFQRGFWTLEITKHFGL